MNWTKILLAGIVGGVLSWLADFVMHGLILGNTYTKYPEVFTQTQANPMWFLAISVLIALFAAVLFSKTRQCWSAGWMGGATFGFYLGLVFFFGNFISALVIEGFPYFLSWCWGGAGLISLTAVGIGLGLVLKK